MMNLSQMYANCLTTNMHSANESKNWINLYISKSTLFFVWVEVWSWQILSSFPSGWICFHFKLFYITLYNPKEKLHINDVFTCKTLIGRALALSPAPRITPLCIRSTKLPLYVYCMCAIGLKSLTLCTQCTCRLDQLST